MKSYIVKTNESLHALNLSFYSLCKLSDVLECVDPTKALTHRMEHPAFSGKWNGVLTLDDLGNFISFT